MECAQARERLANQDLEDPALRSHLSGCADCRREEEAERLLTAALLQRLPQHPASLALKRRLAEQHAPARSARPSRLRFAAIGACMAAAAAVVFAVVVPYGVGRAREGLAAEAVQDHVALLRSDRPLAIVSSGIHEVRPWFAGKLDFAPSVAFGGDAEFPLQGGAVGTFLDRPAAILVFKRRAHTVSLFVVRARGLSFPEGPPSGAGAARTVLGFHVLLWRENDLGFALVSDLQQGELGGLAARLTAAAPARN